MRILMVWLTCVVLLFVITISWYISQGIVVPIAHSFLGDVEGQALSTAQLVEYASIIWGPLFDGLVVLWAIVSSQAEDNVSRFM